MVFPKARLVVSAGLFLAWIGFLAFLVVRTRNPVILSRPQFNVADLVVIADIQEKDKLPSSTVTIKKVAWSKDKKNDPAPGSQITITGLEDCRAANGWVVSGEYLVPLSRDKEKYEVTQIPLSPGYPTPRAENPTRYVTVELLKEGTDKDKTAQWVGSLLGKSAKNSEVVPGILRRNVPWKEAEEFKKHIENIQGKVLLLDGETRIYPATPDALEQLGR
jgi:hypothetical protein